MWPSECRLPGAIGRHVKTRGEAEISGLPKEYSGVSELRASAVRDIRPVSACGG